MVLDTDGYGGAAGDHRAVDANGAEALPAARLSRTALRRMQRRLHVEALRTKLGLAMATAAHATPPGLSRREQAVLGGVRLHQHACKMLQADVHGAARAICMAGLNDASARKTILLSNVARHHGRALALLPDSWF